LHCLSVVKSDVLEAALATREDTSPAHEARKPTDADRFVGQRLRQGRRELGLTQEALAGQAEK
jgi:ribosome-binding protein aMBF1 (putative translation factor)